MTHLTRGCSQGFAYVTAMPKVARRQITTIADVGTTLASGAGG
ncbi:hypothetical protein OIE69_28010 [Actinacidiphila glaucinigra]|nr:hypothetical protein [Actinacidiphila glaucinigra]WSD62458.1 hypothetical protein OIE69_28010 [Actinacidiphila glaucinigra]